MGYCFLGKEGGGYGERKGKGGGDERGDYFLERVGGQKPIILRLVRTRN